LRIAQITATFPPYHGGTGAVCLNNARVLAQRGHDVHVFTAWASNTPAYEVHDGVTIHRLRPLLRVGNAPFLPGLLWTLRGFDILHLHYPFFGGELTALAAKLTHTPLVITYHQDVLLKGGLGLIERVLRWTISRSTLRSAARVLFTSHDYAHASYARQLLNSRESHIGELPNGVDTARFRPGIASALGSRYTFSADDRVVLLVAGLDRAHAFKGVNVLLSALADLPPRIKAVIVGDGALRTAYMERAQALGVNGRVYWAGYVPDAELPEYYRLADLTVLPSVTMGEAFGLVLLESLASGTAVVASALPGVRTVVDDGRDGRLVPPNDPHALAQVIESLLNDDTHRQNLGRQGRAKAVARYDWTAIGRQLEAVYQQLIAPTETSSQALMRGTK